jgi:PIN domain nuclease of toxin-antitoxin system
LKLLLDTHVFLWWWAGDKKIKAQTKRILADADEVHVSVVSSWEVAIKAGLGKLSFVGSFQTAIADSGFDGLLLEFRHVEALSKLPTLHTDPFDRMLIAQAQSEGLTLVTADRALAAYPVTTLQV